MPKKKQPIGYIQDEDSWYSLRNKLITIVGDAYRVSERNNDDIQVGINEIKRKIDALVGRGRQDFTKTDIYQVLFIYVMGYYEYTSDPKTYPQVNTIVAKMTTEGQYGNTGVVRRQTTPEKIKEVYNRIFETVDWDFDEDSVRSISRNLYFRLIDNRNYLSIPIDQFEEFISRVSRRGTRSTTTTRTSNRRTRSTSTPRSTTTSTPRSAITVRSNLPQYVNTETDYVKVKRYINALRREGGSWQNPFNTLNDRKNAMMSLVPMFKYMLYNQVDESFDDTFNTRFVTFPIRQLGSMFTSSKIDIGFTFAMMGFRTTDTNRVLKAMGYEERYSMERLNSIARYWGFEDFDFKTDFWKLLFNTIQTLVPERIGYLVNSSQLGENGYFLRSEVERVFGLNEPFRVALYREEVETSSTTPTPTTPSTSRSTERVTETDTLVRDRKITDKFDFGVEWEHFGVGFYKLKSAVEKAGQTMYPKMIDSHEIPDNVKVGLFPDNQINKGYWVLQKDSTVKRDRLEPDAEFRITKRNAVTSNTYYGSNYDTYDTTELVGPVLGGKRGLAIIKRVGDEIVKAGARHNASTGMHVHITKRGFNATNIKNLFYNYAVMEPIINQMFEPNRRGSAGERWSMQLNRLLNINADNYKRVLKEKILDVADSTFKSRYGNTKYQMLNLVPFYSRNTIEFRGHGGNYEYDTVVNWIRFLFYFAEFSKKKRFQKSSWDAITKILPVDLATFWYNRIQDLSGQSPYTFGYNS